jgi:hypothetical protein
MKVETFRCQGYCFVCGKKFKDYEHNFLPEQRSLLKQEAIELVEQLKKLKAGKG